MSAKIIKISADDRISIKKISEDLIKGIENLIGDYTAVTQAPLLPREFVMFVDENGLLKGLDENRVASMLKMYPIVGDVVIAKTVPCTFIGLSKEDIEYLYPVLKGFGLKGDDDE